ncbi:MAG: 50S ribosomal protein L5 [Candidatus Lloydbacteria bacterium RIFCSPHIGHO2_02_FULL_54_17]|uniref:Large ribosomal subunit protein uL5 n=1 Tax=Candidatus Lloydbacteria bacterium RIFCSPHIGHO2_02_FULL_54_17 TaxID=1798664 RepID=A0A1G2DF04_9BACT|nr:MAG: 50S ribosomal protein L5 [Candidatus Lloydbacteria bacterium RIFCSPHIGHO2_01_FULL_54_11]OGZ12156.1 MAG: 50S ribosomal protein L5 [Candidatus Lloydbacteria bacterium RIFCSPHIGHO2_02_FULL_54_17]OGZ12947.1 MAG: 50S ribosomal protein L5 [Candidatus Lloydbacteria bacterium RIFCSPLOWO2_01_FULL_54_18]OGZ15945.1 MAG: 50S ribosomal protein L5 [Candidatus Lloydbacteria bacterium RIFCSPLOWO2_02_FULL_54_12]
MNVPTTKEKLKAAYPNLQKKYGYKSVMQAPRIEKVVLSVGTGKISRGDKKKNEFIAERLGTISGQKPAGRQAKKSIASFKLREGEVVGQMVTLRGARMLGFLDKFIGIAIPRTKDFRGFSARSIDAMGNFTFGVKEHTVFPETADEDLRDVFGIAITIVLSTKNKEESKDVLEALGFPFRETAETGSRRSKKRAKDRK